MLSVKAQARCPPQTIGSERQTSNPDILQHSMAYSDRYYADRVRGATDLAVVFRADPRREEHQERAVPHLVDAVKEWQAYARVATSQYRLQLFSACITWIGGNCWEK
jgi:hypothetical protein